MAKPLLSRRTSKIYCLVLFLIGLFIISFFGEWWPGIMLVFGIPLALHQYFQARYYDMGTTLVVFIGAFITVQFAVAWKVVLPTLFVVGAIYIFFREFIEFPTEVEEEENINEEIEEKKK